MKDDLPPTAADLNKRIAELSAELGISAPPRVYNLKQAKQWLAHLEEMRQRNTTGQAVPIAIKPAPAAAAAKGAVVRQTLLKIMGVLEPGTIPEIKDFDDEQLRLEAERACWQSHINAPAITRRTSVELAAEFWRPDATRMTGANRLARAWQQERIDALLHEQPQPATTTASRATRSLPEVIGQSLAMDLGRHGLPKL